MYTNIMHCTHGLQYLHQCSSVIVLTDIELRTQRSLQSSAAGGINSAHLNVIYQITTSTTARLIIISVL